MHNPPVIGQIVWIPCKENVQAAHPDAANLPEAEGVYGHPAVVISHSPGTENFRCLMVRYDPQ